MGSQPSVPIDIGRLTDRKEDSVSRFTKHPGIARLISMAATAVLFVLANASVATASGKYP
jgi:hypothetical protein